MLVLIADDQADVRSALKILLEHENETFVFEEADSMNELLLKTEKTKPDLILMDWELPGQAAADAVPVLRRFVHGVSVIALSGRPEAAKAALLAGANAFVSKGENADRLLGIVRSVVQASRPGG